MPTALRGHGTEVIQGTVMVRTLVYKRTHNGDPDERGWFGCRDCMKQVRSWPFTNAIGIGGVGRWARQEGISGKVNWIGLGASRTTIPGLLHPVVTFDHYLFFAEEGPDVSGLFPALAEMLFARGVRATMTFDTGAGRGESAACNSQT